MITPGALGYWRTADCRYLLSKRVPPRCLPENSGRVGTGAQVIIDARLQGAPANTNLLQMRSNALSNKADNNFSNGLGIDRIVHDDPSGENLARTMLAWSSKRKPFA